MTVPFIEAPALASLPGIRHGFFTREGGVSGSFYASLNCGVGSQDDPAHVRENRARVADAVGVRPEALVTSYQVHGTTALDVETPWGAEARPKADALVTVQPGVAVAVGVADCLPVLLADPEARVVAAAHAGWRGAFEGILESAVEGMERHGAQRGRIVAAIGPSISKAAYEVGPEFVARFETADPENRIFFRPAERAGHAFFDLPAYASARLRRLKLASVAALGLCTYTDEKRFFSYRRSVHRQEPDYGRLLAAIVLEP
jgi:YfiH family protein